MCIYIYINILYMYRHIHSLDPKLPKRVPTSGGKTCFAYPAFSAGNPRFFCGRIYNHTIGWLIFQPYTHTGGKISESSCHCPFLVRKTSKLCFCLQVLKMYNVFSMILPVFHVSPMFQRLKFQYLHKSSDTLSSHRIPMWRVCLGIYLQEKTPKIHQKHI